MPLVAVPVMHSRQTRQSSACTLEANALMQTFSIVHASGTIAEMIASSQDLEQRVGSFETGDNFGETKAQLAKRIIGAAFKLEVRLLRFLLA